MRDPDETTLRVPNTLTLVRMNWAYSKDVPNFMYVRLKCYQMLLKCYQMLSKCYQNVHFHVAIAIYQLKEDDF